MILENLLPFIMPVIGIVLLGTLIYLHRDDKHQVGKKILLMALAVFIFQSAYSTIERREKVNTTALVVAGEGANLMMRSYMAFDFIKSHFPDIFSRLKPAMGENPTSFTEDFINQAESILRTALKEAPDSPYLQIRLALVLAEANFAEHKNEIVGILSTLQKNDDQRIVEFSTAIQKIYLSSVSRSDESRFENTIETLMPLSWYRDSALLHLYKATGDSESYNKYMQLSERNAADWLNKIALVIIVFPVVILIGLAVIFIQMCLLAARESRGQQKLLPVPGTGDIEAVVTVLIAWMTNEVIVSGFLSNANIRMSGIPPTGMSALLAITYVLSNAPAWFYIYWFAFRKKNIPLLSGLKISQPKGLFIGRFFVGFISWTAAVPIVLAAFAISSAVFGTHGSQSPVLSMLFQVARSNNLPAICLFYLSLSVLAPLCEEPLFRGLLYQSVRARIGVFGAAVISAFLFAVLHLDPGALLPLFALGLVLAVVFEKSGSLVPSMITHGLWNGANFTISLLVSSW